MPVISSAGRNWFGSACVQAQTASHYLGIRVPLQYLRHNARTLGDFDTSQEAHARYQLLRIFLRINFGMMRNPKVGSNSSAYIEWDSDDALSLPSHFYVHVLYDPDDPAVDCAAQSIAELTDLAAADGKILHREDTVRENLMLRADMWHALCSTYTGNVATSAVDDFKHLPPCDVFGSSPMGQWSDGIFEPQNQVVPMARTDLDVEIFFLKYCPWYQQRQLPELPLSCTDDRAAGLYHMSRMVPSISCQEMKSVWEQLKDRAQRATGKEGYIAWARNEIAHSLHGEQAGYVPKPERAIAMYPAQPLTTVPYTDPTLSPFATWVAKFLIEGEAYAFLYKQHLLLLKLLLGTQDVAREASNGQIHYSAILAGPNSTSKSYVFTLIEEMLIPGTVARATRRTENSLTYSRDQGSRVLIDHEMPGDFFGDCSARDGGARTAQTKEILTSHEATTESCQMIDGERVMVESCSRAHLCYLAATNDWSVGQSRSGDSSRDSALISRFDTIFPTRGGDVRGKSIMALMAADRNPSASERAGRHALNEWIRTLQQANYWIHRSIHIGAMQAVNLDAVHAVIEQYSQQRPMPPRTIERIIIMARQCCIVTAIMIQYAFSDSPRKNMTPQPADIHELEPLLVITAEQAKFALGLYEAELCNQIQGPFTQALRELTYRCDPDRGFNYLKVQGCETATQLADELLMHIPDGHNVSRDVITAHLGKLRNTTIQSKPYVPHIGALHGMAPDEHAPQQQYYAMRGLSFHIQCVEAEPITNTPLELLMQKFCHVGPMGREITTTCVPGYAHLLQTRDISEPMSEYVQQGMFMPVECELVMGSGSRSALQSDHRAHHSRCVREPVETAVMKERGTMDLKLFAGRCSDAQPSVSRYPDVLVDAYAQGAQKRKRGV